MNRYPYPRNSIPNQANPGTRKQNRAPSTHLHKQIPRTNNACSKTKTLVNYIQNWKQKCGKIVEFNANPRYDLRRSSIAQSDPPNSSSIQHQHFVPLSLFFIYLLFLASSPPNELPFCFSGNFLKFYENPTMTRWFLLYSSSPHKSLSCFLSPHSISNIQ